MNESDPKPEGLFASLRKLLSTIVSIVQNRAELFAVELQEEKYRLVELLLLTGIIWLLGGMALMLLIAVAIFLIPAEHRIAVAFGFCILCVLGTVVAIIRLKKRLKDRPFSESVNQIKKDLECLTPPK
jgi:uncharacterized membrane protein YqjE